MHRSRTVETAIMHAQQIGRRSVSISPLDIGQGRGHDPVSLFLFSVTAYVTILCLATLSSSGILKALSYAAAFAIYLTMATVAAYLPKRRKIPLGFGYALALYYFGFIGSMAFNANALDYATAIKMMMAPSFLIFGASFESQNFSRSWNHMSSRAAFALLLIVPLVLWLWQLASGQMAFGSTGAVSIFANRNNAGLYAVTLVALLNVLREKPVASLIIYFIVGVGFGTLGVLLALLVSMTFAVGGARTYKYLAISLFAAIGVLYFAPLEYGIFARIKPVVDSLQLLWEGRVNIATVSYGDLVRLLNTSDLSFLFRLKHWLNLFSLMSGAPFENWIFGFGVGSSLRLSDAGLVPHNDYLRVLFECGPVAFVGFVSVIVLTLYRCGRGWIAVPMIAVAIYFFTENLIDNFVAMAVFFFCGGAVAYRANEKESKCI